MKKARHNSNFILLVHYLTGLIVAIALVLSGCSSEPEETPPGNSVLVIILDGLRPDYVTPELMPNLHRLGQSGVVSQNHHSVFPTQTRVNAAALVTGAYPEKNGLMGNSVYFPAVSSESLSTRESENLQKIEKVTGGHLLTVPSLAEILDGHGKKLFVASAGSSGSAFLLNHKLLGTGVINVNSIDPPTQRSRALDILGPQPPLEKPNSNQNHWAVDAYLKIGRKLENPDVALLWLSDPDKTAHEYGIGAPKTVAALKLVDLEIKRILDAHVEWGLDDRMNIFVTSDHGFSTRYPGLSVDAILDKNSLDEGIKVVNDGAVYFERKDPALLRQVVTLLQGIDSIGAIFTKGAGPADMTGVIPGTLSFHAAHWDHDRSADILVSANWTAETNRFGFDGETRWGNGAGHGTTSPFDIRATLIASGPDIRSGRAISTPTATVDIAPTICNLLGLSVPPSMEGRILSEMLEGGPEPETVGVEIRTHVTETNGYRLEMKESVVDGKRYLDYTQVKRYPAP